MRERKMWYPSVVVPEDGGQHAYPIGLLPLCHTTLICASQAQVIKILAHDSPSDLEIGIHSDLLSILSLPPHQLVLPLSLLQVSVQGRVSPCGSEGPKAAIPP